MTAPTQAAPPDGGGKKQQVVLRPFRIGVQPMDDQAFDQTVTLNAGAQNLNQYELPSTAYLNGIYILVENAVTSSTATTTSVSTGVGVLSEDGPYNVIDTLQFTDTSNSEIIGPIGGWDLYIINKWGGYAFQDETRPTPTCSRDRPTPPRPRSAAGSFSFLLRLPVELVPA
jgi:hypothetical protein